MARANDELLDAIHGLVAGSLRDELERAAWAASQPQFIDEPDPDTGELRRVKNPEYAPLNPQLIDKARAFLKDNGVDAPAKSERVDRLADELASLDLDDVALEVRTAN